MPAAAYLPRSRSLQRRRGMGAWWIAIGAATAANLLIVVLLSQASRMHSPALPPQLASISLHQIRPPAPPPAPAPTDVAASAPAEAAPAPLSLPSLELPAATTADTWALPAPLGFERPADLPLVVPAFAALAAPDASAPTVPPTGDLGLDTPAQRLGAFDLERHYPRAARARGLSGRTRLRLSLDASGEITAWEVLDSTPPGVFEAAAARVVRSLRYRPAQRGGQGVATSVIEVIEWSLR